MDLVIGIGNTLRQDDGLGPHAVAGLAPRPGVNALTVQQLGPELAEPLAAATRVLFVDVHRDSEGIELSPVVERPVPTGHALSPGGLLELTRALYGRAPAADLLTAPGTAFGFGEALSPQGTASLPRLKHAIRDWIEDGVVATPELHGRAADRRTE
jgi:hydrogenase maturation protease